MLYYSQEEKRKELKTMTKTRKELIEMCEVIYGKDTKITEGFKALCATDLSDANLKTAAWYLNINRTTVLLKKENWSNRPIDF